MMRSISLLTICAVALGGYASAAAQDAARYAGGAVFDGAAFEARDLCVAGRVIVACSDNTQATPIDITGLYLTPPFGDAHTHHFDGPFTFDWHRRISLASGAFYAMTMTAPTNGATEIRDRLSGPGNVDVATSLGGITGPQSHPAEIYEALALNIRDYEERVARADEIYAGRRYADDAYYVVATADDVREKMALLLKSRPDHVKIYLRNSQLYAEGWGKWGPGGGVDPALLPLVADLARKAGLRVAVANSSIEDFRASLDARADIVTHLPCYQDTESEPDSVYYDVDTADECLISREDAERAAAIGMAGTLVATEWEKDRLDKLVAWERQNVSALRAAGAPLAVATNNYGSTLTAGLIAGVEKGFFSPAGMLRLATMETPRVIFPDRRVGCLEIGCDASFLGFAANPLDDFGAIESIALRVKDGEEIDASSLE